MGKIKTFDEFVETRLNEVVMNNTNDDMVFEMAKLNVKDDGLSEFPSNTYRVWVQGDNSPHKTPHIHIKDKQEGFEIRVSIEDGKLMSVKNYGKRNKRDTFSDIISKVSRWFKLQTTMPGRVGTNRDAAMDEWEACNAD